jgi:DNA polymerase V
MPKSIAVKSVEQIKGVEMKAIVDCNNFYCSCERLFKPQLEKQPVVVLSNNDGCIISRSDEAKKLGVKMGVPLFEVRELLAKNKVAIFSSNYNLYGDLSWRVMETLRFLMGPDKVEVYSVDEAFIELENTEDTEKLITIGASIKELVEQWTGIKVSVGIAPTKTLAKLANRLAKKDKARTNCLLVLNDQASIEEALRNTAVEDIWGVGYRYGKKLKEQWGIYDAWQLSKINEEVARKQLGGVVGVRLVRELNGILSKEMQEELVQKKMIATTRMFGRDVTSLTEICEAIATYTARAAEKLRRQQSIAGAISIFIIEKAERVNNTSSGARNPFHHGTALSNQMILDIPTCYTDELIKNAVSLVKPIYKPGAVYKKAGVILSNIMPAEAVQTNLFVAPSTINKEKLMAMLDNINFSSRDSLVRFASSGTNRAWKMKQQYCSAKYTTRWEEFMKIR